MKTLSLFALLSAMTLAAPATAFAQSPAGGSCETLAASNPAAYAQLCTGPREFPEFGDQVLGDGDTPEVDCSFYLPRNAPWGERVLVACN